LLVKTLQNRIRDLEAEILDLKRTVRRADNAVYVMGIERKAFAERAWAAEGKLRELLPLEQVIHPDCPRSVYNSSDPKSG
jgi:hypothetical protein